MLRAERDALKNAEAETDFWLDAVKRYHRLHKIDKELLDALIDKIIVFSDRRIEIAANYADPLKPVCDYLKRIEAEEDAV